jgi:hypothetical protein
MKKLATIVIGIIVVLAVVLQLIPYGRDHANPPVVSEPKWDSPETRTLAKRACFDCHSYETVWPWYSNIAPVSWLVYRDVIEARQKINFSDWNRPQGQTLDELPEEVGEGGMPPASYLQMHPNARLSALERQQLLAGLMKLAVP